METYSFFLYFCFMAKRIIISFASQPTEGTGFSYNILINDISLVYDSGFTNLSASYVTNGTPSVKPLFLELQTSLSDTIDFTLSILQQYWISSIISYKRVDNTIEVLIVHDFIGISIGDTNPNISLSIVDVPDTENINLRYFFQYTGIQGDTFLCQIFKRNYLGVANEINGTANIDKGSVKDHLDSIRGTGLTLELEASLFVILDDLYTENEQDFTVKLYRNNKNIFIGFLKPDGVFQSFVNDIWTLSLDCIDGLGALSNLSFVKDSGFRFIGKMKGIDIVYYCLKRSGISLPINTSINTLYDGLTPTDNLDILTKIKMNADRFFKNDSQSAGDGTLMSCEEVLKSVLDIFCACITQKNGEWYIYRPNEIYFDPYVLFRRYDINNVYIGNVTVNTNSVVGSQIDNFYPHHCSGDQRIEIKGGISAFRLGYKYGFVSGLLNNPSLLHNTLMVYDSWTITNNSFLVNDPLDDSGLRTTVDTYDGTIKLLATSNVMPLLIGDIFDFKTVFKTNGGSYFHFMVRIGIYYMIDNGEWTTTPTYIKYFVSRNEFSNPQTITKTFVVRSFPLPISGNIFVEVYVPKAATPPIFTKNATSTEIDTVDLVNAFAGDNTVGEFHTVARKLKISTIVKENKTVYNGDNAGIIYLGAIFKEDGITPTQTWFRRAKIESLPLLQIAASEELRIAQKPLKIFKGSVFGFIEYLSLVEINGIGKFMPIEYSYDTANNITNMKLLELYSAEISDISYKFTNDYGTVTKPTIVS